MKKLNLPKIGLRNIKTALAVFICLLCFQIFGRNPIYAAIAAIVSMQNTVESSIKTGVDRLIGTVIGGLVGVFFILSRLIFFNIWIYFVLIAIGIVAVIYINVLIKKTGSVAISCIVFLIIMVNAESMQVQPFMEALSYAGNRVLDTAIGVIIGVLVNWILRNHFTKEKDL